MYIFPWVNGPVDFVLAMRMLQAAGYQEPICRVVIYLPERTATNSIVEGILEPIYLFDRGAGLPYVGLGATTGAIAVKRRGATTFGYPPQ